MGRAMTMAVVLGGLALGGSHARAGEGDGTTLTVTVGPLRNQKGVVGCRLFARGDGFPEDPRGTREARARATGTTARCTFEGVAPGTYAVSAMHDENENGTLDKNFFGIPREGYGVSNNHTYAMRAPTWDESRFQLGALPLTLTLDLRY